MSSYIVSRLLQNCFRLFPALLCGIVFVQWVSAGDFALLFWETGLLMGAVLVGALVAEATGYGERGRLCVFRQSLFALLIASVVLLAFSLFLKSLAPPVRLVLPVFLLFVLFRCLFPTGKTALRRPAWLRSRVLLVGNGPSAAMVKEIINASQGRYLLQRHIFCDAPERAGDLGDLARTARKSGVDALVVSFPERRGTMPVKELMRCRMQGIPVMDAPTFYEQATRRLHIEEITPGWFIFASGFRLSGPRRAVKRLFDVCASLVGLALAAPLFPLIALGIRLDSPGPIIFRQERTGLGGRSFMLLKFRTMRQDAEAGSGPVWARQHDPRVTALGRFLRQTRLDELPQLLNVLAGDMSLVGPRPERPEFIRLLKTSIPFYSERHSVKPGVTGWAQVRYPYGASVQDALEKLRYDLYYIKNQSFLLDMEIVFRTIGVVISRCGAR